MVLFGFAMSRKINVCTVVTAGSDEVLPGEGSGV